MKAHPWRGYRVSGGSRTANIPIRAERDRTSEEERALFQRGRHEIASEVCPSPRSCLHLSVSRQVHRRSRGPVIMNDAICVRDITREPLAATTCISGSRCVTRLIKIPRDLLRRALAARSRRGEDEGGKGG